MAAFNTEYCQELVEQIFDGVDRGDFSTLDAVPNMYTWEHLLAFLCLSGSLDGGVEFYKQLYEFAIRVGENNIRKKKANNEKIHVVFQSYSAAQWPADGVYKLFAENEAYTAAVYVVPLTDRDAESAMDSYTRTLNWYKENGYNVTEGYDIETKKYLSWEDMEYCPDIVYQLSSWFNCLKDSQWFTKLPLKTLHAYIPYAIFMADSSDGGYSVHSIYNKEVMNLMWRVYCDSVCNLKGYQKYQLLQGSNARYSGYAKMDFFYKNKEYSEDDLKKLWKVPEGCDAIKIKKVIVAPHFSIFNQGEILFSTFKKNAWFFLYLIKKYEKEASFIFKPHPNLRMSAVRMGLFKSYQEYDEYINQWNALPNAKAVSEESYLDYFATSDAMIMDSSSFLGEYLYTGNPLLYLTRPEQAFIEVGKSVVESYYTAPGEDYMAIEDFLKNVVIDGNDVMKEAREKTFKEEFDYVGVNGVEASKLIFDDVDSIS